MSTRLSWRLLRVAVVGGVTVALVTFALTVPLVRGDARDEARRQLVASIEQLTERPPAAARRLAQQQAVASDDRAYGVVRPDGRLLGPAADYLTTDQVSELVSTGTLSATASVDGTEVLIEGRTAPRGFSAIAVQPVEGVDAATSALLRRVVVALLLGLAAAGAVTLLAARRLARSVAGVTDAAHRLAAGERGVEVPRSDVAEVDGLGRAIDALDQALVGSEGRQREFLLSVSHEIRTPLTALRGYAEALADGAIDHDDLADVGATLVAETDRLDRFVADLLALARLEADDFTVVPVAVDVADLLDDVARAWAAVVARAGVELRIETTPATAHSDPLRLRQLVDGLVENAVRATPDGGTVTLRCRAGSEVVVEVDDTGPGLDADDRERAFDRGALRDKHVGQRAVGTGLGLSIAYRLAGRMGASLSAEPSASGGALLRLRLPVEQAQVADR